MGVRFSYGNGVVLDDVNLKLDPGFTAIVGPNGSGKTTLLKIIAGILRPDRGEVEIDGKPVHRMKRSEISKILTLVSQDYETSFDYAVIDVVLMGGLVRGLFPNSRDVERARNILNDLGIGRLAERSFRRLSGGEKRLVLLAKALFQGVEILLVDELELHLDPGREVEVAGLLREMANSGKTIVSVFHDVNLAVSISNRLIGLRRGEIVFDVDPESDSLPELLSDLYRTEFEKFRLGNRWFVLPRIRCGILSDEG